MRITNNMLINNMINYLGNNLNRMGKLQNQLATGKKISVPSDDPVVAARALKLRTDVSELEQYQRNVSDALSWMEVTETTLQNIGDIFQRVSELAVGSDGSKSPVDLKKTSEEVKQLRTQLIHLSNTTYAGRYIFSGFKTDKKLMNDDGTFAIGVLNNEKIKFEIGIGDNIHVNVPGGDLFNNGNDITAIPSSGKMVQDISDLINAMDTADYSTISTMGDILSKDMDNVLRIRADVGARMNRLELTSKRLEGDNLNFTKLMSENEDVDITSTIMNLKNEENVYNASLSAGARIIQPSLVDFLK